MHVLKTDLTVLQLTKELYKNVEKIQTTTIRTGIDKIREIVISS